MNDNRFKFTNRRVADVVNAQGQPLWLYDDSLTGFALTVSPLQRKVFYFVGRIGGRPVRRKIGKFPEVNVDAARNICRELVGDIASGRALRERRKAGRATLGDLFAHYMEVHAKPRKRSWARDEREFDQFIRPGFGNVTLCTINRSDIAKLIATIERENSIGAAHKCRALLSKMFEIGIRDEWCEHNPVRGTDRPKYEPRQRYLKADELSAFFAAVEKLQRPVSRHFMLLCLFTGARRSNVAAMRWDELDLASCLWAIPAGKAKGKKPLIVPLIPQAMEIINRRKECNPDGCEWVLPGHGRTGHYSDPKASIDRIRELSGIKDLRLHDLRRSLGAWQQKSGASLRTIQQTLGHANIDVTARVYTSVDTEQVRASVAAAVGAMQEAGR